MSDIPVIDIIFSALIILMIIHGFFKGFIGELFSWAPLLLAIYAAFFLCPQGAEFIRKHMMENVRLVPEILAFVGIFVIIMLFVKLLERILKDVIQGANLGTVDKVFGAIFGLVEGLALTALILFVFTVQPLFDESKVIGDSFFAQYLLPLISIPLKL